jgi:hypothetical protein
MIQWSDAQPDVNVFESEYKRLLGFPADYSLDGRVRELADWARRWYAAHGKPWIYARAVPVELAPGVMRFHHAEFRVERLRQQLTDAETNTVFLAAVSAGSECEEMARYLWLENKPDEYFFLEIYGSAVVEHLIAQAGSRICSWAEENGRAVLPHYSPGYSGWDTADQVRLFEVIQSAAGRLPGQLRVLSSGMLQPKKSLLAVFGLTERIDWVRQFANLIPCENCSFSPCQFRRAPYRHALPQLEDVAQLQPRNGTAVQTHSAGDSHLERNARYSINVRALRKWSRERLKLHTTGLNSLEAKFRYEGTTCSNLGRPLAYDYVIKLQGPDYRIVDATCSPAPDDTGHTAMCEFISNGQRLSSAIASENPLAGRLLNDVLTWKRPFSPAGCYCDKESRMHKWGLVLEVVHYALAMRGQAPNYPNADLISEPKIET